MFFPEAASHVVVAGESLTPLAAGPRNCGQFAALASFNPAQPTSRSERQSVSGAWHREEIMPGD
jgi:hypothetical protein